MARRSKRASRRRAPAPSVLAVNARDALRAAGDAATGRAIERALHTAQVALEADSSDLLARIVLARIALRRADAAEASALLAPAAHSAPAADCAPEALVAWAGVLGTDADRDGALVDRLVEAPAVTLTGEGVDDWLGMAHAAAGAGRFAVAASAFRRVLHGAVAPARAAAALGLSQLRGRVDHDDVAAMRRLSGRLDRTADDEAKADVRFALGHVAEARGDHGAAAAAYLRGNRAAARACGTAAVGTSAVGTSAVGTSAVGTSAVGTSAVGTATVSAITQRWCDNVERLIELSVPPVPAVAAGEGALTPVFIVGLPRSGTTLVEQVLAAHPAVHAAGETAALRRVRAGRGTLASDYPACIAEGNVPPAAEFEAQYFGHLLGTQAGAAAGVRVVTDKVPGNFYLLAAVALGLPQARVIHVRRDALDVCTSIFTTRFASGHAWTYRFADIAAYHRGYRRLMAHWARTLALPVLDVHYEALVADFESGAKEIVSFAGLDEEPACLAPHQSARTRARAIGSASHWQARQAPTTASVGRFARYATAFAPLQEMLDG